MGFRDWKNKEAVSSSKVICRHCGYEININKEDDSSQSKIYICPKCHKPAYLDLKDL